MLFTQHKTLLSDSKSHAHMVHNYLWVWSRLNQMYHLIFITLSVKIININVDKDDITWYCNNKIKRGRGPTTNYTSSLKRRENIRNETFKTFLLISMLTILFAKLFKEKYEASSFRSMSESTLTHQIWEVNSRCDDGCPWHEWTQIVWCELCIEIWWDKL